MTSERNQEQVDRLYHERTSLRTIIAALVVLVTGLGLLMAANEWEWLRTQHPNIVPFIRELSAFLAVTVAVTLVWELYAKRAFVDELMYKARQALSAVIEETQIAYELRTAGLKVFTTDFWNAVSWPDFFRHSTTLDMFFAYARSWVGAHNTELQQLARRPRARVRVVLPNPENPELMAELGRRFSKRPIDVRTDILDTMKDLMAIFVTPFEQDPQGAPDFSLYFSPIAPVFTFYKFDRMAVIALYKHRSGKGGIPVFVAETGGELFEFVRSEIHGFIDEPGGQAVRVYAARGHQ